MDQFAAQLRTAGLRVTPQRLAIMRALAVGAHLATCQEVWERAQAVHEDLGLVTVYRTLGRLRDAGLVEEIDLAGVAHFGFTPHHHDHLICERCGAVEAAEACHLAPLGGSRLTGSGFLVTDHRLDVIGVCRACQEAP